MKHDFSYKVQYGRTIRIELSQRDGDGNPIGRPMTMTTPIMHSRDLGQAVNAMLRTNSAEELFTPLAVFAVIDDRTGTMIDVDARGYPLLPSGERPTIFKDVVRFDVEDWCVRNDLNPDNLEQSVSGAVWTVPLSTIRQHPTLGTLGVKDEN